MFQNRHRQTDRPDPARRASDIRVTQASAEEVDREAYRKTARKLGVKVCPVQGLASSLASSDQLRIQQVRRQIHHGILRSDLQGVGHQFRRRVAVPGRTHECCIYDGV